MAQKVQILLTDDLDGTEANETVTFGLDGKTYEIDLNSKNAASLRKALEKFIPVARSLNARSTSKTATSRRSTPSGPDPKAVRSWAQSNGIEVPPRGRIPNSVIEQYQAAGN